jgi:hypothetical protein
VSFDQFGEGPSSSTLDVAESAMGTRAKKQTARRRPASSVDDYAVTLDADLDRARLREGEGSGLAEMLMSDRPFVIGGDVRAFVSWMKRNRAASLLSFVAKSLAAKVQALGVRALLDVDDQEPPEERALLLARVPLDQPDALERLFEFTASEWWLKLVRTTGNAIVVDIERG